MDALERTMARHSTRLPLCGFVRTSCASCIRCSFEGDFSHLPAKNAAAILTHLPGDLFLQFACATRLKTDQELWHLLSIGMYILHIWIRGPKQRCDICFSLSLIGAIGSSQDAFSVCPLFSQGDKNRGVDFLSALTIRHFRPVVTGHSSECPLFGNPIIRGLAEKSADRWSGSWFCKTSFW